MLSFDHQVLAVLENRLQKKPDSRTKLKQDYKQPQALACSLGGYSHREHCRAPDDKNYTSKQETNSPAQLCGRKSGLYPQRQDRDGPSTEALE